MANRAKTVREIRGEESTPSMREYISKVRKGKREKRRGRFVAKGRKF